MSKTKITIIDINLGQEIDQLIADDVSQLTSKNMADINKAIEEKQLEMQAKTEKTTKMNTADKVRKDVLEKIYAELLGRENMTIKEMLELASPLTSNTSALVTMLKTFIRKERHNEYVLQKKTLNREIIYFLMPFNTNEQPV